VSDIALDRARAKAAKANVECGFVLADFLKDKITGAPFGFVFDRGCFHTFASKDLKPPRAWTCLLRKRPHL
jgi:hypothetical protein